MFTLEQINELHARLGRRATLLDYIRALQAVGIERYETWLSDGHTEYHGQAEQSVASRPAYSQLSIAQPSNKVAFLAHLKRHEEGKTTYLEMARGLADSGIERWTVDTHAATLTYYDKAGHELLAERLGE